MLRPFILHMIARARMDARTNKVSQVHVTVLDGNERGQHVNITQASCTQSTSTSFEFQSQTAPMPSTTKITANVRLRPTHPRRWQKRQIPKSNLKVSRKSNVFAILPFYTFIATLGLTGTSAARSPALMDHVRGLVDVDDNNDDDIEEKDTPNDMENESEINAEADTDVRDYFDDDEYDDESNGDENERTNALMQDAANHKTLK